MVSAALLAAFAMSAASNCPATRQPWWMPGRAVAHGSTAALYGFPDRQLLCCNGKLGSAPDDLAMVVDWKVHQRAHYAILGKGAKPRCSDHPHQSQPEAVYAIQSADRGESRYCPPRAHFDGASLSGCSGAFNPLTGDLEFAKCCREKRVGDHGVARSAGTGMWIYPTEAACRAAACPPATAPQCGTPNMYALKTDKGEECALLAHVNEYSIETRSSCGWDDLQARMGSSSSLQECLEMCSKKSRCRSVEHSLGPQPLCIMRSETCTKRTPTPNVNTYIKKRGDKDEGTEKLNEAFHLMFVILLIFVIVGLLMLGALQILKA